MKNKKILNFIKFSLISFIALSFINIIPAQALPNTTDPLIFQPQVGLPGLVDQGQQITLSKGDTSYLALMVKGFYDYGLSIAGILAAIVLMAGGVIWLTSGGSSDKISQAKGLIAGSITGLLLLFGAWIMLKTINPYLLDFKIRDIKGIVAIFMTDGADGFIDGAGSLPKDAVIKYECLGVNQTCADTSPPSMNLDIFICKNKFPEDITCTGNTSKKWCCARSEEAAKEIDQQCVNKESGTRCQVTPTDTTLGGFCHDNKCDGKKVCCLCGQGCLFGVCAYASCKNDVSVAECNEWCTNGWVGYGAYYYAGGSNNYTCAGGAYSYCTAISGTW